MAAGVAGVVVALAAWFAVPVVAMVAAAAISASDTFAFCAEADYTRATLSSFDNARCSVLHLSYTALRRLANEASAQSRPEGTRWVVGNATWYGDSPDDEAFVWCGPSAGASGSWCAAHNLAEDDDIGTARAVFAAPVYMLDTPQDGAHGRLVCRRIADNWACAFYDDGLSYATYLPIATKTAQPQPTAQPTTPAPALVRINHATAEGLDTLPHVGPVMAAKIIAARPLASCEDADGRISGWGPVMVAETCPLVDWAQ